MNNIIYGAYEFVPKNYYLKDGVYKEYKNFFESELDCLRECIKHEWEYDVIHIQPSSEKCIL